MPLLSRKANAASNGNASSPDAGGLTAHGDGPYANGAWRPSFREWAGLYWKDLLTMAAMGAVGLGVYEAHPAPSRSFPVTFADGEVVFPDFAYPLRKEIVPIWLAALLAFTIPTFFFLVFQFRLRSFEDLNCAVMGLLQSLINAAVFQVFLKWLIGGLRPHFLAVCAPDLSKMQGNGFNAVMFDRTVCTGDPDEIDDSLESFPSGHSTAAWAGFLFLSLYFNAKLKLFADRRPEFWKMILFFAPLLGATLIAGALTIDEYHNWYDVLAGSIIGGLNALASFRMSYAAIWDFRFNHVPLPRLPGHRMSYSLDGIPAFPGAMVRGDWRGGVPGDAVKTGAAGAGLGGSSTAVRGEQAV